MIVLKPRVTKLVDILWFIKSFMMCIDFTDTLLRHVKSISEVPMNKASVRKKYFQGLENDAVTPL